MRFYPLAFFMLLWNLALPSTSQGINQNDSSFDTYPLFGFGNALESTLSFTNSGIDDPVDMDHFEPSLSAECEPLAAVASCVNVISGHFFQVEKDLKGTTIEPLDFARYYDSGNQAESFLGYGFASGYPLWASDLHKQTRHHYAVISERENFLVLYRNKEGGPSGYCYIDPKMLKKGYTNLCRSTISGHANFVNWRASFGEKSSHDKEKPPQKQWIVQLGDGTRRYYSKRVEIDALHRSRMNFPTKSAYLLKKEIKPNGNQLIFTYTNRNGKPCLASVKTINRTGKFTLNEMKFDYSTHTHMMGSFDGIQDVCTISDIYGNSITYHQEEKLRPYPTGLGNRFIQRNFLTRLTSTQQGDEQFELQDFSWKMKKIQKEGGQLLEVKYHSNGKVRSISEKLEEESVPVDRYKFDYQTNYTQVVDAVGQVTHYHIDDHERLSRIKYFDQFQAVRDDIFEWSTKEEEIGWLKSKSIRLNQQVAYCKIYDYDLRGNISKETLYGNLTGEKEELFLDKEKMEKVVVTYDYSKDTFNLLKKKTTPQGLTVYYEYLPGSNLCTKILYRYEGKIQERIFKAYDDNAQLKLLIEDDGSSEKEPDLQAIFTWIEHGYLNIPIEEEVTSKLDEQDVTFRKVKKIDSIIQEGAAFGKSEKIKEYYRDKQTGKPIFLKETTFVYDQRGCEYEKTICDSKGTKYTTTNIYDERLRLRKEINPLGYKICYEYDERNNVKEEQFFDEEKIIYSIHYIYDLGNRLREKLEIHDHGQTLKTTYKYNNIDQLIEELDPYGHKITYEYDRLGNQISCKKPSFKDEKGTIISPTITKEYNLLNQVTSITNENGQQTKYSYNVYGSPIAITYPDEAKERMIYYPWGGLKEKHQADGTTIEFEYDQKGHLIKKSYKDKKGKLANEEIYLYKGSLLQFKRDGAGLETKYEYDGAGRKIKETIGDWKIIHYTYDEFDRLILKKQEERQENFEYDGLNRITAKTQNDNNDHLFAKETYEYDIHGNKIKKNIWQSPTQEATYRMQYYSDSKLSWKENPLNHRTQLTYDHYILQEEGIKEKDRQKKEGNQKDHKYVTSKTTLDALGRPTFEVNNPLHWCVKKEIFDGEKKISSTLFEYDAAGNCIKEHASIMTDGKFLRDYWIERSYNNRGLVRQEKEMPTKKTTLYEYDSMCRLWKKTKPDGIILTYTYDSLGRVFTLSSSDNTIHYTYHYDLHDNIVKVEDHVHHFTQQRTFNNWNQLKKEEMSPGNFIEYEYDCLDRLKKMTLPDQSVIYYTYNAYHLTKIERFNPVGKQIYAIECPTYDLRGHLLEIRSPAGSIHHTYDILGRAILIKTSLWESQLEQFDPVGNLYAMTQKDPSGVINGKFDYDRFSHLIDESLHHSHQYTYDSIGNCLKKNGEAYQINLSNQLEKVGKGKYGYDANGNLKTQSSPSTTYTYDALNRLIECNKDGNQITFLYDAFGRCLQIKEGSGTNQLLYQGDQEIGSLTNGTLQEFRLVHPEARYDLTFAIELKDEVFFPIQDFRGNVCGLQRKDGNLVEWVRYSAFGEKVVSGNLKGICNPWRFANRREIAELSLFTHRFYNLQLMRWQTADPLGFKDGLNLYAYVHNNPFYYKDPDGQFAFAIPLIEVLLGPELIATVLPAIGYTVGSGLIGYSLYELIVYASDQVEGADNIEEGREKNGRKRGKDNQIRGGPARDPLTGNYVPDPAAEGTEHTTLGIQKGRRGSYVQGATFDKDGEFTGRTDVTDHGRSDHTKPHFHPATGPNSAKSNPQIIADMI